MARRVNSPIRLLCVDDHRLMLEGLALLIGRERDMEVVASASTGEEAVALFQKLHPDVTLMDLRLKTSGMSGLQALCAIHAVDPESRIVVLTMYQGDEDVYRAMQGGAAAYVLKDTLSDDLIFTIREVYAGRRPVFEKVAAVLAARGQEPALTPREKMVTQLITTGMRNKEIARALGITGETVKMHVKNILGKLKVKDRTAVATAALRRGIVHLD